MELDKRICYRNSVSAQHTVSVLFYVPPGTLLGQMGRISCFADTIGFEGFAVNLSFL